MNRRGASMRTSTPIVIILIALILILYILFLPPTEREALLSGTSGGSGGYSGGTGVVDTGSVVVMDKYVGTLRPLGDSVVEHSLPATTVFTMTNTEELKFIDSVLVRRSAFSRDDATITFNAEPNVAKNYLLTFNVDKARGPLRITLNGQPVFERVVESKSPAPIVLPSSLLQAKNTLVFSVGSAGWSFWRANTYELRNVLVSADVTSYEGSAAEQHFTITPEELEGMERAAFEFVPQCDPGATGRLTLNLNGKLLYAGFIDCGVKASLDVSKEALLVGDNRVGFTSTEGSYTIDQAKVVSYMTAEDYPVFYFNLPPDMFQQANVFAGRLVVTLRFTEGNDVKQGSFIINGFQDSFQTSNYYYQATLDPNVLVPNANSIQLLPATGPLHVAELRVEMIG